MEHKTHKTQAPLNLQVRPAACSGGQKKNHSGEEIVVYEAMRNQHHGGRKHVHTNKTHKQNTQTQTQPQPHSHRRVAGSHASVLDAASSKTRHDAADARTHRAENATPPSPRPRAGDGAERGLSVALEEEGRHDDGDG